MATQKVMKPNRIKELSFDLIIKAVEYFASQEENMEYFTKNNFQLEAILGRALGKEGKKEGLVIEIFDTESKETKHVVIDPTVKKEMYSEENIITREDFDAQMAVYNNKQIAKAKNEETGKKLLDQSIKPIESFEKLASKVNEKPVDNIALLAQELNLG